MSDPLADAPEINRLGAQELLARYRSRALSPFEVAESALARAEDVNARFNAFTSLDHDRALAAARASAQRWAEGRPCGALDGLPVTIKDLMWVEGWPMRAGSTTTSDAPLARDAPAVALLRSAGAILIGSTTTPEFGWKALGDSPLTGVTRNPWDPAMTPGGSSSGAAVAAATGAGVMHLGSDGGGSIRVPSAFTGVFGLKPTFGRVPVYPASPFGTVSHIGPMTRRVDDAALMLETLSRRALDDWHQNIHAFPPVWPLPRVDFRGLRIGLWMQPPAGRLSPEIAAATTRVAELAQELGTHVEDVVLPGSDLLATFQTLWFCGAAARLATIPAERHGALEKGLREIADLGRRTSAAEYIAATMRRSDFGAAMDALLARVDLLLSPATTVPAFAVGEEVPAGSGLTRWIEWASFSFPINMSQQPACSLPAGLTGDGLPIGVQIVGPRGGDDKVLAAAAALLERLEQNGAKV